MNAWGMLALTIMLEITGTIFMKLSDGLTRLVPSMLIFVSYGLSFAIFTLVIKHIELSIAYAIWAGVGTLAISIIGILVFKEHISLLKGISILFIVVGIVGLKLAK